MFCCFDWSWLTVWHSSAKRAVRLRCFIFQTFFDEFFCLCHHHHHHHRCCCCCWVTSLISWSSRIVTDCRHRSHLQLRRRVASRHFQWTRSFIWRRVGLRSLRVWNCRFVRFVTLTKNIRYSIFHVTSFTVNYSTLHIVTVATKI